MFSENFAEREIDLTRIKNTSEFDLKPDESKILFSKDNKYAVISTESTIFTIDMNKRILLSKLTTEPNSRIAKLKITPRNEVTYLNIGEKVNFVVSSINFFGALKIEVLPGTKDYVYVRGAGKETQEDFLITLSANGDLQFETVGKEIKQVKTNIIKGNEKQIHSGFEVNYMDYIEETKNLIIILANGTLLNYTVYINPEIREEIRFSITQEKLLNLDGSDSDFKNTHEVTIFKVVKYLIFNNTNFGENTNNLTSSNSYENVCLIIGSSVNKSNSIINFYQLYDSQVRFVNKIKIEKRVILDSLIHQPGNFYQNEIVSNYFLICTKVINSNKVEIFSTDFIQCLNKEFSHSQENMTRVNEFEEKVLKVGILGVQVVPNQDLLSRNLNKTLPIINNDMCERSIVSNIDDYKNSELSLNVTVRKMKNFSDPSQIFVEDVILAQMLFDNKERFKGANIDTFDDKEIRGLITSNVFDHVIQWDKLVQSGNSAEKIRKFKERVVKMLNEDPLFSNFTPIHLFFPNLEKIDYFDCYLVSLLLNNEFCALKTYLSLKSNSKEFLVPNNTIYNTVYVVFFTYLREMILKQLKEKQMTNLIDERLLRLIENIKDLMGISLNRLKNPYSSLFSLEEQIQAEDIHKIKATIYSIEMLVLVVKVIQSYYKKFGQSDYVLSVREKMKARMKRKQESRLQSVTLKKPKLTYFELVLMVDSQNLYPDFENFLYSAIQNTSEDDFREGMEVLEANQYEDSNDFLYFLKFRVFFYYFYYILESEEVASSSSNSNSFKQSQFVDVKDEKKLRSNYFNEMEDEFDDYFVISKNLFSLDSNILNKREGQLVNRMINVTKICDFLVRFNQSKISSSNYFKKNINVHNINFKSILTTLLYHDDFKMEALAISKSIFNMVSDEEDLMTQLSLLQDMGLINLAFQFVNNCFANLVCYSKDFEVDVSLDHNKNFLENLVKSKGFETGKRLYFHFFEFLITHSHISLLFTLPFNFVERSLLKNFLTNKKEYEEILLTYLISLKKGKEASEVYSNLVKSCSLTPKSAHLYENLINAVKLLFNDPDKSQVIKSKVESALTCDVNILEEKRLVNELKESVMNVDSNQELADKILIDSMMDIENEIFKPECSSLNETFKSLISKKNEFSKKNFGMLTDIKPARKMVNDFASERYDRNFIDNSKFKSDLKDRTDQSGFSQKDSNVRLEFNSDVKMITSNFARSKLNLDLSK